MVIDEDKKTVAAFAGDFKQAHEAGVAFLRQFCEVTAIPGDIVISSDESKVVFYTKRFKVQNSSINGVLHFRKSTGEVLPVPEGSFVPFEVEPTYNRIGTISIHDGGAFELRLRSEYKYDWNTDNVKFQFNDNGVIYEKVFDSIGALYSSLGAPIILEPAN